MLSLLSVLAARSAIDGRAVRKLPLLQNARAYEIRQYRLDVFGRRRYVVLSDPAARDSESGVSSLPVPGEVLKDRVGQGRSLVPLRHSARPDATKRKAWRVPGVDRPAPAMTGRIRR